MAKHAVKTQPMSDWKVFGELINYLWDMDEAQVVYLAGCAGVHKSTLYAWKYGYTNSPQIRTLTLVARELGYDIALVRTKKPSLKVVKKSVKTRRAR